MKNNEASDQKAIKIVLFMMVLFACVVAAFVGFVTGWKAGVIALLLLMLPAVAIYRFSGNKHSGTLS